MRVVEVVGQTLSGDDRLRNSLISGTFWPLEAGHHPEKVSGTLNGYALMTGLRRLSG